MRTLARFVLRHKLIVVALWLLATVAGLVTVSGTVGRLDKSYTLPGHPGYQTDQRIARLYDGAGVQAPTVPVITLPAGTTVDDPGVAADLGRVFGAATAVPGARVADFVNTGDRAFVTADGRTSYALVFTRGGPGKTLGPSDSAVEHAVRAAAPDGWRVQVTGLRQLEYSKPDTQGPGVVAESMIGVLGALVVLAFVFSSFLAVVPLLMAAASIMTTFLLLRGLTAFTSISFIAEYLVALIGLGVAIDYSLLVITRWREERSAGADNQQAVVAAAGSAGRAVAFSGVLVGIGLLALVTLPVPFLRSLGYAALLIPLVSLAVAVTLLPVLLATIGPRLDWPHRRSELHASPRWQAWARLVVRHRWPAAVGGLVVLALLVVPLFSIDVGQPKTTALAASGQARGGLDTLTAGGVPSGTLVPISVLVRGPDAAAVAQHVGRVPGVHDVVGAGVQGFSAAGTSLLYALPTQETQQPAGQKVVEAVRTAVDGRHDVIGVGGPGAQMHDFDHAIYGNFWKMIVVIAFVTFALLALALRSILLPLKAIAVNLLSVAAAFGAMVLIWQKGYGSSQIWGVDASGTITFWVPVFVFAFLFGLSMDYEVFILSRVREEYDRTGSTHEAMRRGLERTGRLVSCAALILAFAFLAMSTGPQTDIKILATGLGVGILLDATVVRCMLVPALVALFGRANWWLPGRSSRSSPAEPMPAPDAELV